MLPEGNSTCSTCLLKNLFCTFVVVKVAKAKSKGKLTAEWKGPHLNGCQSEQRALCSVIGTSTGAAVPLQTMGRTSSRMLVQQVSRVGRNDANNPGASIETILLSWCFNIALLKPRHTIFSPNMKGASII